MPIIFPFTDTGVVITTVLFFAGLIYCGLTGVYLDGEKNKRHLGLRISLIFAILIMIYSEYSAVNIGLTIHPPKNANIVCKG